MSSMRRQGDAEGALQDRNNSDSESSEGVGSSNESRSQYHTSYTTSSSHTARSPSTSRSSSYSDQSAHYKAVLNAARQSDREGVANLWLVEEESTGSAFHQAERLRVASKKEPVKVQSDSPSTSSVSSHTHTLDPVDEQRTSLNVPWKAAASPIDKNKQNSTSSACNSKSLVTSRDSSPFSVLYGTTVPLVHSGTSTALVPPEYVPAHPHLTPSSPRSLRDQYGTVAAAFKADATTFPAYQPAQPRQTVTSQAHEPKRSFSRVVERSDWLLQSAGTSLMVPPQPLNVAKPALQTPFAHTVLPVESDSRSAPVVTADDGHNTTNLPSRLVTSYELRAMQETTFEQEQTPSHAGASKDGCIRIPVVRPYPRSLELSPLCGLPLTKSLTRSVMYRVPPSSNPSTTTQRDFSDVSSSWSRKGKWLYVSRYGPTAFPNYLLSSHPAFPSDQPLTPFTLFYFDETAPNKVMLANDGAMEGYIGSRLNKMCCRPTRDRVIEPLLLDERTSELSLPSSTDERLGQVVDPHAVEGTQNADSSENMYSNKPPTNSLAEPQKRSRITCCGGSYGDQIDDKSSSVTTTTGSSKMFGENGVFDESYSSFSSTGSSESQSHIPLVVNQKAKQGCCGAQPKDTKSIEDHFEASETEESDVYSTAAPASFYRTQFEPPRSVECGGALDRMTVTQSRRGTRLTGVRDVAVSDNMEVRNTRDPVHQAVISGITMSPRSRRVSVLRKRTSVGGSNVADRIKEPVGCCSNWRKGRTARSSDVTTFIGHPLSRRTSRITTQQSCFSARSMSRRLPTAECRTTCSKADVRRSTARSMSIARNVRALSSATFSTPGQKRQPLGCCSRAPSPATTFGDQSLLSVEKSHSSLRPSRMERCYSDILERAQPTSGLTAQSARSIKRGSVVTIQRLRTNPSLVNRSVTTKYSQAHMAGGELKSDTTASIVKQPLVVRREAGKCCGTQRTEATSVTDQNESVTSEAESSKIQKRVWCNERRASDATQYEVRKLFFNAGANTKHDQAYHVAQYTTSYRNFPDVCYDSVIPINRAIKTAKRPSPAPYFCN